MTTSLDIENYPYKNLRPFIVSICGPIGKGQLCDITANLKQSKDERYIKTGTTETDVKTIFEQYIPEKFSKWQKKRLLLYAHGGLVSEQLALQRAAAYSIAFLEAEVYPLSFIWHTGFYETLNEMFEQHRDLLTRFTRPQLEAQPTLGLESFFDTAKHAVLDWLDARLEAIARDFGGKQWKAMKDRAKDASTSPNGGAYIVLKYLKVLKEKYPDLEIHVIGHSAGSIFHAYLIDALIKDFDLAIDTCTLWAPACRVDLFKQIYLPAINRENGGIRRFILSTLTETAELNDSCTNFYHKSILYLVSNALEDKNRSTPLLGMEKFIKADPQLKDIFNNQSPNVRWLLSPNTDIHDIEQYSTAERHGEFSSDLPTLIATRYHITQSSRLHLKSDGEMR